MANFSNPLKIAVIGDIHKSWTQDDVDYFNQSDYNLILFMGDLPGRTHKGLLEIAGEIALIQKPALLIPGNHDGVSTVQLLAELTQRESLIERSGRKQDERCNELELALGQVKMVGYSRHTFRTGGNQTIDLIAGRPHSMGGPDFSYRPYLKRQFGVDDFESSGRKICDLVDEARGPIIFMAHNGPTGLGVERTSIWGCDFKQTGGDFGDLDLRIALDYAREQGKKVLGVLAGHMHQTLKGSPGIKRRWFLEKDGTTFVNSARVPRIFRKNGAPFRHHVQVLTDGESMEVNEILVGESETISTPGSQGTEVLT